MISDTTSDSTPLESKTPFRSQSEIVAEIDRIMPGDILGFKTADLIGYLDYGHARKYLKPEVTPEMWNTAPSDRESILKEMEEYMAFAWGKANNRRGISAARSLAHYTAWIWMIGDQDKFGNLEEYQYYGKDHLRKICEIYGWDADQWDDNIRTN